MKGILLISHGDMAKGMHHSASIFMGKSEQFDYLCLQAQDDPEVFQQQLQSKLAQLDTGDGVIVLADLFGGTPCNQSIRLLQEHLDLIAGMNFTILLEVLSKRMFETDIDVEQLIKVGQAGLLNVKNALDDLSLDED